MTTTTAAAGAVMKHLDFVARRRPAPDLDVALRLGHRALGAVLRRRPEGAATAQLRARHALSTMPASRSWPAARSVVGVSGAALPHLLLRRARLRGRGARPLWRCASTGCWWRRPKALGGGPYGMEALNVLRIEKGFITHAEIHGRVTAFDIGLQGMVSKQEGLHRQDRCRQRPGLMEDREELVGLRPIDGAAQLTAGALLFAADAQPVRENAQGYVTSACHSPTLGMPSGAGIPEERPGAARRDGAPGRSPAGRRDALRGHVPRRPTIPTEAAPDDPADRQAPAEGCRR